MRPSHPSPRSLPQQLPAAHVEAMSKDEFYRRYPASGFVDSLEQRRTFRWWVPLSSAGLVAALAVGVFLLVPPQAPKNRGHSWGQAGGVRDKGAVPSEIHSAIPSGPQLFIEAERPAGSRPVEPGSVLGAQEVLRFFYDSSQHDYLFLFSVDDRGLLSIYYPDGEGSSIPIQRGHRIPLQDRVVLDDYRGSELFISLFSDRPLDEITVRAAVERIWSPLLVNGNRLKDLPELGLPGVEVRLPIVKR